jgi:hypothetical protein
MPTVFSRVGMRKGDPVSFGLLGIIACPVPTAISWLGTREFGDTRDWTETPGQRQLRLKAGAGGGPALLGPDDMSAARLWGWQK